MSKEIEKLDQSLFVINEVGAKLDDMLENKKNEKIMLAGAAGSARELKNNYDTFVVKAREKLAEEVKNGQIGDAVAKYVFSWIQKSEEFLTKFSNEKTAQLNVKNGEITALESSIKVLKIHYDMYDLKKSSLLAEKVEKENSLEKPIAIQEVPAVPEVKNASSKPGRKTRRSDETKIRRPDEAPHVADTVKRLKQGRKKKS